MQYTKVVLTYFLTNLARMEPLRVTSVLCIVLAVALFVLSAVDTERRWAYVGAGTTCVLMGVLCMLAYAIGCRTLVIAL